MRLLFIFFYICSFSVLASEKTILILGDSLSAGYGIAINQGWVSLLQNRLSDKGYNYQVINASITGDTSRGASARIESILKEIKPVIAVVELGGNDGLRGISPGEMSKNLALIIEKLSKADSQILLIPMQLPPNYGPVYNGRFQAVYDKLAGHENVTKGQFILADIGDKPELMQSDGLHPTAEAQITLSRHPCGR